jgi:hypothetical protein
MVNAGEDVHGDTPKKLDEALAWNGGMQSRIVRFVKLERIRFSPFTAAIKPEPTEHWKALEDRAIFSSSTISFETGPAIDVRRCLMQGNDIEFESSLWAYRSTGATFHCTLGDGNFLPRR